MRLLPHARHTLSVRFADPDLVSSAGPGAVVALAARCGLAMFIADRVRIALLRWAQEREGGGAGRGDGGRGPGRHTESDLRL